MKAECLYKHLANTMKTVEFYFVGSEIVFFHIPAVSTLFTCRFTCRFSPILRVVLREVCGSERAIFLVGSCSTKKGVHAWGRCTRSVQSAAKSVYVLETLISNLPSRSRARASARPPQSAMLAAPPAEPVPLPRRHTLT